MTRVLNVRPSPRRADDHTPAAAEANGHVTPVDAAAGERKITHYYRLDPEEERGEAWFLHWRRWLHQHGPVLIALGVDRHFIDGAPLLDDFDADSVSSHHAAALVGYGEGGFMVRCSWGTDWGRGGYAAATEAYLDARDLRRHRLTQIRGQPGQFEVPRDPDRPAAQRVA